MFCISGVKAESPAQEVSILGDFCRASELLINTTFASLTSEYLRQLHSIFRRLLSVCTGLRHMKKTALSIPPKGEKYPNNPSIRITFLP
jgi:hypothetical protein